MTEPKKPTVSSALLAAAAIGALWGVLENGARLLTYRLDLIHGEVTVPEHGALDWAATTALAGLEYAVVGLVLGGLALLLLAPLLAVVRPSSSAGWRVFFAPRFAVVFAALFLNLFWWSRFASRRLGLEFMRFAYGEPWTSPKRLLLSAGFVLLSALLAAWLVFALRRLGPRAARARAAFLVVLFTVGAGFLLREHSLARADADRKTPGKANVLLVIVDTLRAESMHCYGYPRPTTPRLDRIAEEGVLFERAVAQAPYTWTSFGSIFTGKYPRNHGLVKMDPTLRFDPKQNVTLQSTLDAAGYRTAAFMTGMLSNASGLLDGFQTYLEAMIGRDPVDRVSVWSYFRSELVVHAILNKVRQAVDADFVASEAIDWIEEHADERFLCVVHLYSTHTPYDPPSRYDIFSPDYDGPIDRFTTEMATLLEHGQATLSPEDHQRIVDLYDAGVLFADAMIGDLVDTLERKGILDETVVIVTSDHGEELGEHGRNLWEHDWMYNTNQLVPLILRLPERRGARTRVDCPVELIDLFPTALELVGLPKPKDVDGESLVPWIDGKRPKEDDVAFCENNFYVSIQDSKWKVVANRFRDPADPPRLYHLEADPHETRIVGAKHPEVLEEYLERLWAYDEGFDFSVPRLTDENPEIREQLAQLGYLSDRPNEGVRAREAEEEGEEEEEENDEEGAPPGGE